MTISQHIRTNWAGMLVIGDVHGDYRLFDAAVNYAEENKLFLASLGDLVDRSDYPYEVVKRMHTKVKAGEALFTVGNHDDKYRRFRKGAKVHFSRDGVKTFADVGKAREEDFLDMYLELCEDPVYSGMYHNIDNIILVHAAYHPAMVDTNVKFGSEARSRALFGEVNGEKDDDGYPVRLYNWLEEIPNGKTVIVGHDRVAVNRQLLQGPLTCKNRDGGEVIFIDTGCGKGGHLSGVVLKPVENEFKVTEFVDFK